ncbi:hypothetical protein MYSTI_03832 [Myxococcus stipitatus DSM 14675]|uniref:Outer membrane protein beta-barrel domain-containing protein n=1 Tax=Myxococcus stipitatus (strain DSM 14675 / JCM 12634 / Mx s8) TaxID=1278073 RepID=L7UAN7_MYXSD|nr:hypothetical protein [Myxococcus stipitatus]AGC45138.1 hypothetical protein MYSTI_03832 [Myxococcus stipitatus DSM 14675]
MMNTQHAMVRWGLVLFVALALASPGAQAQVIKKRRAAPVPVAAPKAKPRAAKARKAVAPKEESPRVVVLTVEGDRGGKVRTQLESALRRDKQVKVASLKQYATLGKKSGLKGSVLFTDGPLASVAPKMKLAGAISGTVGPTGLTVRVLDASGAVLGEQEVKLTRGKLSPADAKVAVRGVVDLLRGTPRAFEAPSSVSPSEPLPTVEPAVPVAEAPPKSPRSEPVAERPVETPKPLEPAPVAERPVETPKPLPEKAPRSSEPELVAVGPQPKDGPPAMEEDPESHTTTDPFLEVALDTGSGGTVGEEPLRPPLARLTLGGTTTWRKYCTRPGVKSCGEFDKKSDEEKVGDRSDFESSAPYLGISAELELLPLARHTSPLRGLGLVVGYRRGYASTDVTLFNESGQSGTREVVATDSVFTAQAMYRYFFGFGSSRNLLGYAGVKAGMLTRSFDVDAPADSPLSSTHRLFPAVGLEVSVPLLRQVRLEAAGQFFIGPKPGKGFDDDGGALDLEVSDYGTSVSSFGWEAELGVAGEVWGPFGYQVRFELSQFKDTFSGAGTRSGWNNGGVAEDTYSSIHWSLTASY